MRSIILYCALSMLGAVMGGLISVVALSGGAWGITKKSPEGAPSVIRHDVQYETACPKGAPEFSVGKVATVPGDRMGTAFKVGWQGESYYVTNAHVVNEVSPVALVVAEDGSMDLAYRVYAHDDVDIAILKPVFASANMTMLSLGAENRYAGPVTIRGFSALHLGQITAHQQIFEQDVAYVSPSVLVGGASGSPAVNCAGEVVSVLRSTRAEFYELFFYGSRSNASLEAAYEDSVSYLQQYWHGDTVSAFNYGVPAFYLRQALKQVHNND